MLSSMALNIKDPETDRLARALADVTGETLTDAVATALRERLDRVQGTHGAPSTAQEIERIARRCAALPVLDSRSADEILGYDRDGVPT
jgi:antitoxin VapB